MDINIDPPCMIFEGVSIAFFYTFDLKNSKNIQDIMDITNEIGVEIEKEDMFKTAEEIKSPHRLQLGELCLSLPNTSYDYLLKTFLFVYPHEELLTILFNLPLEKCNVDELIQIKKIFFGKDREVHITWTDEKLNKKFTQARSSIINFINRLKLMDMAISGRLLKPDRQYSSYLFDWDDIQGIDKDILKDFLLQRFGIDCKNVIYDREDKSIKLHADKGIYSLELNHEETEVKLKIYDEIVYEFKAARNICEKNSKLKIYNNSLSPEIKCLIEVRNISSTQIIDDVRKIITQDHGVDLKNNANILKQIYGLLASDDGWRFVPSDTIVTKLQNTHTTRDYTLITTLFGTALVFYLSRSYMFTNKYVGHLKRVRDEYKVDKTNPPNENEIAGSNSGVFSIFEYACLIRYFLDKEII